MEKHISPRNLEVQVPCWALEKWDEGGEIATATVVGLVWPPWLSIPLPWPFWLPVLWFCFHSNPNPHHKKGVLLGFYCFFALETIALLLALGCLFSFAPSLWKELRNPFLYELCAHIANHLYYLATLWAAPPPPRNGRNDVASKFMT